jgi:hypothetical protein
MVFLAVFLASLGSDDWWHPPRQSMAGMRVKKAM